MQVKLLSYMRLFVIPWTVAYQAPLSREFSRQEYWSELPFPIPGDLPDPGTEPPSLMSPALAGANGKPHWCHLGSPSLHTIEDKKNLSRKWQ